RIDELSALPPDALLPHDADAVVESLLVALEKGDARSAERTADGAWHAVTWVKRGILLAFRAGRLTDQSPDGAAHGPFAFFAKHPLPTRALTLQDGVRVVPGGSTIRRGAHVARGVVCMPPMYINVGAWIGAGTMVDSHALVGSCAQIGERVHLSAAAQIGGVLEPVGSLPVIIEDDVLVGGNCGIYEGAIVRARAVLAAGVIVTGGAPLFVMLARPGARRAGVP